MYLVRTPSILKPLSRDLVWEGDAGEGRVYLTFDDGPTPSVTDAVLDHLKAAQGKATFFCLGKQVAQHPAIYERIRQEGHQVGNHSYSHRDGWKTSSYAYVRDVLRASALIDSALFRPPYGRISRTQAQWLKKRYRIIMWSLITGDFEEKVSPHQLVKRVEQYARPGSIIVLHDSTKAGGRMLEALPGITAHIRRQGWQMASL